MTRTSRSLRRLSFQSLETRQAMAGDVAARMVEGDLLIDGGPLSNGVQITAGPAPGSVQVAGLSQAGFATKINHQTSPQTFQVPRHIIIDLGDGDNRLLIDGVGIRGSLKVATAEGSDVVRLTDSVVGRNLVLDTGDGNDHVVLRGVEVCQNLDARLRTGDDYFGMHGSHVAGEANLNSGWNADRFCIESSRFDANLHIESKSVFAPTRVNLSCVQVRGALSVETGDGDDRIRLSHVSAEAIAIVTAEGEDTVDLDWVTADHVHAALGAGRDPLSLGNSIG